MLGVFKEGEELGECTGAAHSSPYTLFLLQALRRKLLFPKRSQDMSGRAQKPEASSSLHLLAPVSVCDMPSFLWETQTA